MWRLKKVVYIEFCHNSNSVGKKKSETDFQGGATLKLGENRDRNVRPWRN